MLASMRVGRLMFSLADGISSSAENSAPTPRMLGGPGVGLLGKIDFVAGMGRHNRFTLMYRCEHDFPLQLGSAISRLRVRP